MRGSSFVEGKYIVATNQAFVSAPYGLKSLYSGITLIQEKQERKFLESFHSLDLALLFLKGRISSVAFVENHKERGSFYALVKEYIIFERKGETPWKFNGGVPDDAEAIGYSIMPGEKVVE